MHTATYSPDDNKLRLYPACRLDAETYARMKAAGFKWAPKQEVFVAPMWTPTREDLLIELAGEIGDEDTSLTDRAEERSDRFENYRDRRADDANSAHKAVKAITEHIPLGQPILVGHHSERHARRDVERIRAGMSRAVKMWETSQYWEDRAASAIRHAKYKERPDVRARRIKTIESDKRKREKAMKEAETFIALWQSDKLDLAMAKYIANRDHISKEFPLAEYPRPEGASTYEGMMSLWSALEDGIIDHTQAREIAVRVHTRTIKWSQRWIAHYDNRLSYERVMLAEIGGTVADRKKPEAGGGCVCWASPHGGWSFIRKVNKVSVTIEDNWGNGGGNFRRTIPFDKLSGIMTAGEVEAARKEKRLVENNVGTGFFLKDAVVTRPVAPREEPTEFDILKEQLKHGVQVAMVDQLIPTPRELAMKVIAEAEIRSGHDVLEPSAGTGALAFPAAQEAECTVECVEIDKRLINQLVASPLTRGVHNRDFLECTPDELGRFDRIVMNPPFSKGQDIDHVRHAVQFLKPGGRLVAIMCGGPFFRSDRKSSEFRTWMDTQDGWSEKLPDGSFAVSGCNVSARIVVIDT